jgi:hypothetical protein
MIMSSDFLVLRFGGHAPNHISDLPQARRCASSHSRSTGLASKQASAVAQMFKDAASAIRGAAFPLRRKYVNAPIRRGGLAEARLDGGPHGLTDTIPQSPLVVHPEIRPAGITLL